MRLLSLILLLATAWPAFGVTWNSDGSRSDVQAIHDNVLCLDGDTITLPSGTFTYTTGLTITKAITLQGLGTITRDVHGRATACGTKLQDNVNGDLISGALKASKTNIVYGIEFVPGTQYGNGQEGIDFIGVNTDSRRLIIDSCVWNQPRKWGFKQDTCLGVFRNSSMFCFKGGTTIDQASYWDGTQGVSNNGNGSWADDENYGTDQFFFYENNNFYGELGRSSSSVAIGTGNKTFTVPAGIEVNNTGSALSAGAAVVLTSYDSSTGRSDTNFAMYGTVDSYSGSTLVVAVSVVVGSGTKSSWILDYGPFARTGSDGQYGCRVVWRYNDGFGWLPQNHGKEASETRGGRCSEFYGNVMTDNGYKDSFMLLRSGTTLVSSNTLHNYISSGLSPGVVNLVNYSSLQYEGDPHGGPDGRNTWHYNGAAAIETITVTSSNLFEARDSSKTWTLNQFQNKIVRATSGTSVASVTRSGSDVDVKTFTAHGLSSGDEVSLMGADQRWYNKVYANCTVVNATNFTVTITTTPASPATGTILCRRGGFYGLIKSSAVNGTIVWAEGVNEAVGNFTLRLRVGETAEINTPGAAMDQCGMGAGQLLATPSVEDPPMGWPDQVVTPCRSWGNFNGAGTALTQIFDNRLDFSGALYASIVQGVHCTNLFVNYTRYTMPWGPEFSEGGGGSEPAGDGPTGTRGQRVTKKIRLRR